jgi:adenylate kinase
MRLVLVGPPGSGKGTQARLLVERLGLTYIGTGEILREAVRQGTETGRLAEPFLRAGQLVPDKMVNELVAERFHRDDRPARFVMDGYPRTKAQAVAFDQMLLGVKLDLGAVISYVIADGEVVKRLVGDRRYCPADGSTYSLTAKPPKLPGRCDVCGRELVRRDDDTEDTIRKRLRVFHECADALIEHYRAVGKLVEVSALDPIEAIYQNVLRRVPHEAVGPC